MHHETYAAKGEFDEITLARGRRLRSYFAKRQCSGAPWSTVRISKWSKLVNFNFKNILFHFDVNIYAQIPWNLFTEGELTTLPRPLVDFFDVSLIGASTQPGSNSWLHVTADNG